LHMTGQSIPTGIHGDADGVVNEDKLQRESQICSKRKAQNRAAYVRPLPSNICSPPVPIYY
jgi:hypothetical protein